MQHLVFEFDGSDMAKKAVADLRQGRGVTGEIRLIPLKDRFRVEITAERTVPSAVLAPYASHQVDKKQTGDSADRRAEVGDPEGE